MVHIWSRNPQIFEGTKPAYSTVWSVIKLWKLLSKSDTIKSVLLLATGLSTSEAHLARGTWLQGLHLQGYLAHKKPPPPS